MYCTNSSSLGVNTVSAASDISHTLTSGASVKLWGGGLRMDQRPVQNLCLVKSAEQKLNLLIESRAYNRFIIMVTNTHTDEEDY